MRIRVRAVSLLLAAILLLAGQRVRLPGDNAPFVNSVPSAMLSAVRESAAAIDRFIVDGNLAALWQTLDRTGHALDPWPQSSVDDRDRIALAFRSTFPTFRIELADIAVSDGIFAVQLEASGETGTLPTWLDSDVPSMPPNLNVSIALDDRGATQRIAGMPAPRPLAEPLPDAGAPFPIADSARLVAARVTLTPSDRTMRYLSIDAPAVLAPESGPLRVEGRGRLLVHDARSAEWRQMAPGETALIWPGDLLSVTTGHAIVTMTTFEPITSVYVGIDETEPPGESIDEDGRPVTPELAHLATASANAATSTWFGAIEPLAAPPTQPLTGMATFSSSWLVAASGTRIDIDSVTPFVVVEVFGGNAGNASTRSGPPAFDPPIRTTILLVVRLTSHG